MYIGKSKKDQRISHWADIKSRVTTHEGEVLSGKKGEAYQVNHGKKLLGIDYKPTNFNRPEYQKELAKTR